MDTSKNYIFDKLKLDECVNKFKKLGLNTVMLFRSYYLIIISIMAKRYKRL